MMRLSSHSERTLEGTNLTGDSRAQAAKEVGLSQGVLPALPHTPLSSSGRRADGSQQPSLSAESMKL